MNKLQTLHLRTSPIIPLTYDDSLSYLEVLAKLTKTVNQCIETLDEMIDIANNHETRITALESDMINLRQEFVDFKAQIETQFSELEEALTAKVDQKIDEVNAKIAEIERRFDILSEELNARIDQLVADTNAQIAQLKAETQATLNQMQEEIREELASLTIELNTRLTAMERQLTEAIANLDRTLEAQVNLLKMWVEVTLEEFLENLPDYEGLLVVSPVTGQLVTVQTAINDIYEAGSRLLGLTAIEYDSLNLTADGYDALGLTAQEYDLYAKNFVNIPDPELWMYSPFDGQYVPLKTVIMSLCELHKDLDGNTLTATEYDTLELEAQVYDDKEVTAYEYDWNARNLLTA